MAPCHTQGDGDAEAHLTESMFGGRLNRCDVSLQQNIATTVLTTAYEKFFKTILINLNNNDF